MMLTSARRQVPFYRNDATWAPQSKPCLNITIST